MSKEGLDAEAVIDINDSEVSGIKSAAAAVLAGQAGGNKCSARADVRLELLEPCFLPCPARGKGRLPVQRLVTNFGMDAVNEMHCVMGRSHSMAGASIRLNKQAADAAVLLGSLAASGVPCDTGRVCPSEHDAQNLYSNNRGIQALWSVHE